MSDYLKLKSDFHKVRHIHSGKLHFYDVYSDSGKKYNVSLKFNCDCDFYGIQGNAKGLICSHILAVLNKIVKDGEIKVRKD